MTKRLLLVDLENVHKIDLSLLDKTYRAIIFVGAKQNGLCAGLALGCAIDIGVALIDPPLQL